MCSIYYIRMVVRKEWVNKTEKKKRLQRTKKAKILFTFSSFVRTSVHEKSVIIIVIHLWAAFFDQYVENSVMNGPETNPI